MELLFPVGAQFVIPGRIQTVLGFAAMYGHIDIVQYLVSEGAPCPVNAQGKWCKFTYACLLDQKH